MGLTVGFDATAAARQAAGIGRYTRELLGSLSRLDGPETYHLYYASGGQRDGWLPPLDSRFRCRGIPVSDRQLNILWHRLRLPIPVQLMSGSFDVFHSPDFTLPPVGRAPSILTIHDLAFLWQPDCAYPTLRAYLEQVVPRSAHRATHLIAVSENTARDVQELLRVPADRITVIPEGVGESFHPISAEEARPALLGLGLDEPYLLAVGTLEPRKNYPRLIEAYAALRRRGLRERLVIAGRRGWMFEPIFERVRELGLDEHVTFITPPDEVLPALYHGARVCVYASLYEGFGIPALEALACGTPLAASRASSLPEVVGDAALTFDPLDAEDMVESIWRLWTDEAVRCDLRRRGVERAAGFTWERAAHQTLALYRTVAGA